MKRMSYKSLLALANEEAHSAKLFAKWGLWRFARDEEKHASFFKMIAKRKKSKRRRKK